MHVFSCTFSHFHHRDDTFRGKRKLRIQHCDFGISSKIVAFSQSKHLCSVLLVLFKQNALSLFDKTCDVRMIECIGSVHKITSDVSPTRRSRTRQERWKGGGGVGDCLYISVYISEKVIVVDFVWWIRGS